MLTICKGLVMNDYGKGENYATYIMNGTKTIETRMGRNFTYRGDLIICCGKTNSVTAHKGKALCMVELWKVRDMQPGDADAAGVAWHPNRKSLLLRNWRHFDASFDFAACALQRNFQGMFDMFVPEGIKVIPRPDIIPFLEIQV